MDFLEHAVSSCSQIAELHDLASGTCLVGQFCMRDVRAASTAQNHQLREKRLALLCAGLMGKPFDLLDFFCF